MTEPICNEFAVNLLGALSQYNLDQVRSMFAGVQDGAPPLEVQFPEPNGFQYRSGVDADSVISHYTNSGEEEVEFDFEMPFEGDSFRPMMIRTIFRGTSDDYSVILDGVVPT